jgi:hypothetical protein
MIIIPGILINNLVNINGQPIEPASNNNIGILVVAQAPTNINIFENLLPLFISTAATGNAAYRGPAEKEPSRRAKEIPSKPDFSPISLIMVYLGTQISKSPSRRKMGGTIINISIKLLIDISIDFDPIAG